MAGHRPPRRQRVDVVRGGVLGGLEGELRRRPADHDGKVIRRAGRRAQRADLLVEELQQALRVQDCLGLLEEEGFVRAAAALGHEQELVLRSPGPLFGRIDLDLRGQVGAGVLLVVDGERGELRVAQIELRVRVVDAARHGLRVIGTGQHPLGLLAHDNGRAGVLAHGEHATGGDVDVLEQVQCDKAVVARRFGIVDNPAQLLQVCGPQVVADVVHRRRGQRGDRGRIDLEELPAVDLEGRDAGTGDKPVGRLVRAGRQEVGVLEIGSLCWCAHNRQCYFPPAPTGWLVQPKTAILAAPRGAPKRPHPTPARP